MWGSKEGEGVSVYGGVEEVTGGCSAVGAQGGQIE